jgi:hypothetical protein
LDIFKINADITIRREKNLSFNRFTALCVEMKLFSQETQLKFLGVGEKS